MSLVAHYECMRPKGSFLVFGVLQAVEAKIEGPFESSPPYMTLSLASILLHFSTFARIGKGWHSIEM